MKFQSLCYISQCLENVSMADLEEMAWEDDELLDFNGLESQIEQIIDKSEVQEMLRIQLAEFEMLQSMFSNPKELEMDDPHIVDDIEAFVKGVRNHLPPRLDFRINLIIGNYTLEVYVNLSHEYPLEEPDLFVRGNSLTKNQQNLLNKDLAKYISSFRVSGEICVCLAITWLQENTLSSLVSSRKVGREQKSKTNGKSSGNRLFCRYWNYSQLIDNKMKVKRIVEMAEACNLSGFCMKGKPAVVCVEGCKSDCEDWLKRIHQMNWKAMVCKMKEEELTTSDASLESFRRFKGFEEITFKGRKCKNKNNRHSDMGEFHKFLLSHDCGHVFKDIFGVDSSIVPSETLR